MPHRTFRYDRHLHGGTHRYLNLEPSKAALAREREQLRALINKRQGYTPLPELIARVNRHLEGWANYYRLGYPRKAYRHINFYVHQRLRGHLRRRSQRPWRPPKGRTHYEAFRRMGLTRL